MLYNQILKAFSSNEKEYIQNILEIIRFEGNRIAFDIDTDGIVSVSLLKSAHFANNMNLIPTKIKYLKNDDFLKYLNGFNWHTIIDLPPFPLREFYLYKKPP